MKLYNLYQDLILEQIKSELIRLSEAMSDVDVDTILGGDKERQGKFYKVNITYDNDGQVSNRFIEIYQRNTSTIGNPLIDAYQLSKNNQSSGPKLNKKGQPVLDKNGNPVIVSYEGWRKFNMKKITSFKVTGVGFYEPQNGFNPIGNNSPTVSSTSTIADIPSFGYKSPTAKNLDVKSKWQGVKQDKFNNPKLEPTVKAPTIGPEPQQPEPQPVQQPQVQPKPQPKQNNNPELPPDEEEDLTNNL
jgi:hypothetical protein